MTTTLHEPGKKLEASEGVIEDAVFGATGGDGPDYRNICWIPTSFLMVKTQIGIGALSLPGAFNRLGLIPGVIDLIFIAGLTTLSDYIIGRFKLAHPHIYGLDDAGQLMSGRVGREVCTIATQLCKLAL
ncbi:Transmembrane amino acid transporter-like protein 2 [Elsinoe fawcettii]|nr:Transmembrane amino acid transporter-like protein 2 [Elsinoe fawcettii]